MSQARQPGRDGNGGPRPDPALHEQFTGDGDRAGQAALAWFSMTTPGTIRWAPAQPITPGPLSGPGDDRAAGAKRALHAGAGPRPAPEPEKPAAPGTGRPVRCLTPEEISYFLAMDTDRFFDEDFYRDLEFYRAIDREPEPG